MATKTETGAKTKAADDAAQGFDAFTNFFKTPLFDAADVFEYQRKNMEAAVEAQRLVFDGFKAAAQKNLDLAKDNMAELNGATTDVFSNKTPEVSVTKSFEFCQVMARKNLGASREAVDLLVEANQKAVAVLQKRIQDGADQWQDAQK